MNLKIIRGAPVRSPIALLAAVLLIAPVAAYAQGPGSLTTMSEAQIKRVYHVGVEEYPKLFAAPSAGDPMRRIESEYRLSVAEVSLLVRFCQMYFSGASAAERRK